MRILGIDPGLATVGIGTIEWDESSKSFHNPDWCTITTPAGHDLGQRLLEITKDLSQILKDFQPDLVVIEKLFFSVNEKTALDVAHARGAILLEVGRASLPILEPTPMQLKLSVTGDGGADKTQMQDMLVQMLKLTTKPQPDDAADALGLAVYGALMHQTLQITN